MHRQLRSTDPSEDVTIFQWWYPGYKRYLRQSHSFIYSRFPFGRVFCVIVPWQKELPASKAQDPKFHRHPTRSFLGHPQNPDSCPLAFASPCPSFSAGKWTHFGQIALRNSSQRGGMRNSPWSRYIMNYQKELSTRPKFSGIKDCPRIKGVNWG